jgi:hypothetical protein
MTSEYSMNYVVNVIFVRDSVEQLLPFFQTLLTHTEGAYRIVANGCTNTERATLTALVAEHRDRLSFFDGGDEVLSHGRMLERLLEIEEHEYFVIVDSDILAVARTSFDTLVPDPTEGARCSGLPVWQDESDFTAPRGFRGLGGRFVWVEGSVVVVGCSYAASYHTEALRSVQDQWGITFESVHADALPEPVRTKLAELGLLFETYDTLKVANILLHAAGSPISLVDLPGIVHVGALSKRIFELERPASRLARARRRLGQVAPGLVTLRRWQLGATWHEARNLNGLTARRHRAREFMRQLADGTASIEKAPPWCRDPDVYRALEAVSRPIEAGDPKRSAGGAS